MNVAIITAGGVGSRMGLSIPKQFYVIDNKPLILYTLEAFQNCKNIDLICVVYLNGYKKYFEELIKKEKISKAKILVEGGETNQMSIYHGLLGLAKTAKKDDLIIVHDGIRPLVSDEVIESVINVCNEKGNAIAVVPSNEAMVYSENKLSSINSLDRNFVWKTQTPHAMRYGEMIELVESTISRGVTNSVAICTMLIESGKPIFFSKGNNLNFKITNPEDIELFKGIIRAKKENENL